MRAGSDDGPKLLGDLTRKVVGISGEQVFTNLRLLDAPQVPEEKDRSVWRPAAVADPRTYVVSGQHKPDAGRASCERPSGGRADGTSDAESLSADLPTQPTFGTAKLARSKADRKGGWPWTVELSWAEVRYISELDKAATDSGAPLNRMVTIRGSSTDTPLAAEKARLAGKVAHIGQALHRAGFEHIGLTVYERKRGKELHAHHLLHVPRAAMPVLARFHSPPDVKITTTTVRRVSYVTKQREQLSPDFERTMSSLFSRQPGDYIPGPRYSLTGALAALVPSGVGRPPTKATPRPRTPPCQSDGLPEYSDAIKEGPWHRSERLALTAPVVDIRPFIEQRRKASAIPPQRAPASYLGWPQSQCSNDFIRRYDPLSLWAQNRLRDLAVDRLAA